jgi:hypothetical protein
MYKEFAGINEEEFVGIKGNGHGSLERQPEERKERRMLCVNQHVGMVVCMVL